MVGNASTASKAVAGINTILKNGGTERRLGEPDTDKQNVPKQSMIQKNKQNTHFMCKSMGSMIAQLKPHPNLSSDEN